MNRSRAVKRQAVLRKMLELATSSANDAIRLAYLTESERNDIEQLELAPLTEFKRNSNGTVEIKLVDRAAVLEMLLDKMGEEDAGTAAFLQALEQGPAPRECSDR